jgi:hypothetical protein
LADFRHPNRRSIAVKRFVLTAALVSIASTVVVVNATATPSKASHKGKSITLHLVAKDVGSNFVDNPPRQGFNAPPLIGDQFTFTSDLQTRSGKHAGRFAATCVFASGEPNGLVLCHGFYSLKGGQIMGIAKGSETNTTHVAIVGGTGAYEGVTGSSVEVSRSGDSPFTDVTIHLLYP